MYYPTAQELTSLASKGSFIARLGGNSGHFVTVESISKGMVNFWNPAGGISQTQALKEFTKIVSGLVWK